VCFSRSGGFICSSVCLVLFMSRLLARRLQGAGKPSRNMDEKTEGTSVIEADRRAADLGATRCRARAHLIERVGIVAAPRVEQLDRLHERTPSAVSRYSTAGGIAL